MNTVDRVAHANRIANASAVEKVLFSLSLLVLAVALPPWPGSVLVLAVVVFALLVIARVPVRSYLELLRGPLLFLAVSVAPLLASLSFGQPGVLHLGWAPDGSRIAMLVTLRALAALNCLFFLILTTPVPQILGVMRRCRVPSVVTEISLLVYRYIWVFTNTVGSIRRAQEARLGYSSLRRSYRSFAMLTGAFFGQALERGRALERGLDSRNWQGELRVLDEATPVSLGSVALIVVVDAIILLGTVTRVLS